MIKNQRKDIHHPAHIRNLPPTILTIFGATGDLAADYLLPALLHMEEHRLLPADFKLACVGRRDLNAKSYFDFVVKKSSVLKKIPQAVKNRFFSRLIYYRADFDSPASFAGLSRLLSLHDRPESDRCYNRLYYFATSPQYFAGIARMLKAEGLLTGCAEHKRQVRILVEKPFGFNLASARALNSLLLKNFSEEQIYRIDHYQGKETVQNLMVVRFANSIFEPLWNKDHIDHVEISVLETDTAKLRAVYYDQTGAIRDFVQNHVLQVLSLLTMDEPYELTAENIRNEKNKILKVLRPFTAGSLKTGLIKGQYVGYAREAGGESRTETFVALKAFVDTPRWQGVPFYLRTGKALHKKVAEVSVHFKEPARCIFKNCAANILTFRLQPDESVHLQLNNKIPGFGIELHQGDYEFGYKRAFASEIPGAYERLLLDFIEGDQRLFIRSDEIESSWKFIDSIIENPEFQKTPVHIYKPKTTGPAEAEAFIKKDLREWWTR